MSDASTSLADDDFRRLLPRFSRDAMHANRALVELLEGIAADRGATPAQIALAWVLAQRALVRSDPRHHEAGAAPRELAAVDIQRTAAEVQRIEEGTARIPIQGARSPAQLQGQSCSPSHAAKR